MEHLVDAVYMNRKASHAIEYIHTMITTNMIPQGVMPQQLLL